MLFLDITYVYFSKQNIINYQLLLKQDTVFTNQKKANGANH